MTKKEAKIIALTKIWGWATYICEGVENGELSEDFSEEVDNGEISEKDALQIQQCAKDESDLLIKKIERIRLKPLTPPLTN